MRGNALFLGFDIKMKGRLLTLKIGLALSFFCFSMLLNSLTAIILKFSDSGAFVQLGSLQLFKDIPIAICGALLGNYIPRFGYLRSLIWSLILGALFCLAIPLANGLYFFEIWFFFIGIAFAILKIAVIFITVHLQPHERSNNRTMQYVEASFMAGVVAVNLLFGGLLGSRQDQAWHIGFFVMGFFCFLTALVLYRGRRAWEPFKNHAAETSNLTQIFHYFPRGRAMIFLVIIFLILFIEQCFTVWLPSFSKLVFRLTDFTASLTIVIFALSSLAGRLLCGYLALHRKWNFLFIRVVYLLLILLIGISVILLFTPPNQLTAYLIPLVGFAIGPLYPLINSHHLFKTPKEETNALLGYLIIFTSLGSSAGSLAIGYYFHYVEISTAYVILVPFVLILLILFYIYHKIPSSVK